MDIDPLVVIIGSTSLGSAKNFERSSYIGSHPGLDPMSLWAICELGFHNGLISLMMSSWRIDVSVCMVVARIKDHGQGDKALQKGFLRWHM